MSRHPATLANVEPGVTVFRGPSGRIALTVTGLEPDPQDPVGGQTLVVAKRPGCMESVYTLAELYVDTRPAP